MTNLERDPALLDCAEVAGGTLVQVLEPRDVPLGGPRAMTVRRTLPQRRRSLIGAWCFLDSYGPDDVSATGGMRVLGHPHTGLQTVTWLFEGEVEHRDTLGTLRVIRPGEVNLMTAGAGIAHSEFSTPGTTRLRGAQLWIALPDSRRRVRGRSRATRPRSSRSATRSSACSSASSRASALRSRRGPRSSARRSFFRPAGR